MTTEGALSRWSRLKREAARGEAAPPPQEAAAPPPVAEPEEPGAPPLETLPEAEQLERLGLPDPDTLEKGADFAAFLRQGVPQALKRRALRRLWRSDPVLACLDGLNDYDADYTDAATATGAVRTAWKVGRGYLDKLAAEPPTPDAAAPAAPPPEAADEAAAEAAASPPSGAAPDPETARTEAPRGPAAEAAGARAAEDPAEGEDDAPAAPRPRRMRFAAATDDLSQ